MYDGVTYWCKYIGVKITEGSLAALFEELQGSLHSRVQGMKIACLKRGFGRHVVVYDQHEDHDRDSI